jgi:uncharacterized protein (DUF1697 family)
MIRGWLGLFPRFSKNRAGAQSAFLGSRINRKGTPIAAWARSSSTRAGPEKLYFRVMAVLISLLRGVNLGPHHRIKMDALRSLYESLQLEEARTYVQSGNVIFRTKEKKSPQLAKKIQSAIERAFGFSPEVILRTTDELRKALAVNPFAGRSDVEPGKLLVTFLAGDPGREAQVRLGNLKRQKEELHLVGRELYIYFPDGAGKSKLPWSSVEKLMQTTGTARNLNSVMKIIEIAEQLEAPH